MDNTFVNISNSFSINELLRGYKMKIYCEDPYGSMVELTSIISEGKDSRKLDLRYLQYLLGGAFFEDFRSKIPDDINHIILRLNTLYHAGSISERKAIEILSNTIIFNKRFKVLLYFKNYDETLNPFCGFELFNSFEELQEVVKMLPPRCKLCETNEELNEMLKPYSSNSNSEKENRYNNIIKLLIILFCCSRRTEW